ncbi:MAG TPA: ABC transporter ATP-binding protein [Acidimicrobiia bacterium]|nr:ABC transporter ATP-binding protein [Acidimicrobiia bacterium]
MTDFSTFRVGWEMIRYRPGRFFASAFLWTLIHGAPVALGVAIGSVFDRLTDSEAFGEGVWSVVLVFIAIVYTRQVVFWLGDLYWIDHWNESSLQLRRNMLAWLVTAPRSRSIPVSPSEAVSTFRDDVDDMLEYMENWVDLGGVLTYAIGAVAVMLTIDAGLTVFVLVPLLLTLGLTQSLSPQIRKRRRIMRVATEDVTGFVGELFGGVQAVKLADATEPVLARFDELNDVRRRAALRDTFLTELLRSINSNMATIAIAIVLLVAASDILEGTFTVGELAVFLTYLPRLTSYMAFAGDIVAQHRRTGVAYERIRRLTVDAPDLAILDRTRVPLRGDVVEPTPPPPGDSFRSLQVENLGFRYPSTGAGLSAVSFSIHRGEFVVITGKIGSGKTTLVRALLGLIPAEGQVRWNGDVVDDPASFLVPPRTAYTAQVPRLFSESLAANIGLGSHVTHQMMRDAVELAILDPDVANLERGLETAVGARGVKLSGGQVQRSAAARAFATGAELLVFDDISSALDVETEASLWDGLFARRDVSCLVVSHRRPVLQRADRVILMEEGRIVAEDTLRHLLATEPGMQALWEDTEDGAVRPGGNT